MTPLEPLTLPQVQPWEFPLQPKFLSAVVFFKEESHALVELVLHLISQGFDHVFLVDNMSDHPLPLDALKEFQRQGYVTLTHDSRSMAQKPAYADATQRARMRGYEWLMAVDADEFPWATQLGSIRNYLLLRDEEVCTVAAPFRLYGSDGREDQPNSLLQGFVGRTNSTLELPSKSGYKTMARLHCTMWMAVHHAALFPRHKLRGYAATSGFPRNDSPMLDYRTEGSNAPDSIVKVPDVLVNHYRRQSHRFFLDIKQFRGKPNNNNNVRDEKTFREGDRNHTQEYILANRARHRFGALYNSNPQEQIQDRQRIQQDSPTELAWKVNYNYTSPWPMENVLQALNQLRRHQVLAIIDADSTLPDALAKATRNAAILDPTIDCVAWVPPGHAKSVEDSKLTKFCKTVEAHSETQSFMDFVTAKVTSTAVSTSTTKGKLSFSSLYQGYMVLDQQVILSYGTDTALMRMAAIASTNGWTEWKDGLDSGIVKLIGRAQ